MMRSLTIQVPWTVKEKASRSKEAEKVSPTGRAKVVNQYATNFVIQGIANSELTVVSATIPLTLAERLQEP
jgi:hypothetical protein